MGDKIEIVLQYEEVKEEVPTEYEIWINKIDTLLEYIPHEFHSVLRDYAYDRGHNGGYEEVYIHLEGMVNLLMNPIQEFSTRIVLETIKNCSLQNAQRNH